MLYDRWDDFGYKTRFPTFCRIDGQEVDVGAIRILFAEEKSSHPFLTAQREAGWNAEFPLEAVNYISVPEQITFYEQLDGLLQVGGAREAALKLRDASYLAFIGEDADALALVGTRGFEDSVLRERSAQKAFSDGWKLLTGEELNIADLNFEFQSPLGGASRLQLNFEPKSQLPHDINVIIGPNGVGKSSLLRQMVRSWIQPQVSHPDLGDVGFRPRPNLSQLVAVSYSPFERLPVDADDEPSLTKPLKDKDIYRFFGFRGRSYSPKTGKPMQIRHSLSVPRANAAHSLIRCLSDDLKFSSMKAWANKLRTLKRVVGTAMQFDQAAVRIEHGAPLDKIIVDDPFDEIEVIEVEKSDGAPDTYLPIVESSGGINLALLIKHIDADDGVTFFRGGEPLPLSSGQRLFFYIVVNVLGVIRRNSLIIVDEPELFLHPTLEVQFVAMLKQILETYNSKALLATHSVLTVREVPSACVHVFEATDDGLQIKTPPFETFGGDVQRISSYVFGDRSVSKPYEGWLKGLLDKHGSADAVIEALGRDINEEMIIQLHAMESGKW